MKFYKCNVCGNVVTKIEDSGVPLVCCGQEMEMMKENTDDSGAKEKHIPIVIEEGRNVCVEVGEVIHPSTEEHFIKWVMVKTNKGHHYKMFHYGDKPSVCFNLCKDEEVCEVYAYCNIHGLWCNKIKACE